MFQLGVLASTLAGYIAQVRLSLRASTMVRVEGVLREFACWLAGNVPEVACVAGLRRRHIETYKLHLAGRPSARGGKLSRISLAEHLGALRACFERLTEWDGDDVPAAVLVFSRIISWPRQTIQTDEFRHFKSALSTESYSNSGLIGH